MTSGPPSPSGKAYSRKSHGPGPKSSKASVARSFDAHNGPVIPTVTFSLPSSPAARRELRRRLSSELSQVRTAYKRINSLPAPAPSSALSATDPSTPLPPHPSVSKHKSKKGPPNPSGSAEARRKLYVPVFKTCAMVLARLMKHKHGWVFNVPVDASALGLHDYHTIIAKPMDLGTVKSRLAEGHYKSPREFASEVRLTFQNAMKYNPKGQDVYFMAEQLLNMFEEKWPEIEAEMAQLSPQPPTPSSAAPKKPREIDNARVLERSDSTAHAAGLEATPKPQTGTGRPPVLKKPKAREPNKREMTFWEKQRLSNDLQDLPAEKLDNVVQIIKKRNSSLNQHDDEIEVDIDSFDVETLWELDRFVTNYKKSITKNKRKAELSVARQDESEHEPDLEKIEHARQDEGEQDQMLTVQETIPEPEAVDVVDVEPPMVDVEPSKEIAADDNGRYVGSSSPAHLEDQKGDNAGRLSSSGSSSSESGSSSSDTDSDSSSADGSDAAQSPKS